MFHKMEKNTTKALNIFDEVIVSFLLYRGPSPPFNNTGNDAFQHALLLPKRRHCFCIVLIEMLKSSFLVLRSEGFALVLSRP